MPIKINGTTLGSSNNLTFNGVQANYATLNGNIVWSRASSIPFTVADTGASFSVSTTTVYWTPPSTGTLVGSPTYSNGQNLGTVSTDTNRTQTFTVTVPNDSQWSNANQNVTFSLSDIQELTVLYPPIISGLVLSQSATDPDLGLASWNVDLQGYSQIGSTRLYFNGIQTTASGGFANLSGMDQGTTESLTIEIDTNQGTGSATTSTFFLEEFLFTDGFVSGSYAVNANGVPSATLQNGATNLSFSTSQFALSCTSIPRGNTVSFTVPSGYWNSGDTVSGNPGVATQPGYGSPATAGSIAETSGSLTNIPASGGNGEHSTTITNPTSVGEWNIVYGGTGMTPTVRSGCGNKTAQDWTVAANTGPARSGTITLYAGSSQTTVLDTLSWNQAAGVTSYSHILNKSTSSANACAELGTDTTVYSGFNVDPISGDDPIYSNSLLTNAAPSGWYSDGTGVGYWNGSTWSSQTLCNLGGGPE